MIKLRSCNQFMFSRHFISLEHAHLVAQDHGLHASINRKAFPFTELREPRWQPNRHQRKHGLHNGYACNRQHAITRPDALLALIGPRPTRPAGVGSTPGGLPAGPGGEGAGA